MQFRVLIPVNVKSGQLIRIRCPDGTEGDVKVPKGLHSGDSFVFEMPETIPMVVEHEFKSFLDREIVNIQDFLMALGVGLLIGLSIVTGFLCGVLVVTQGKTTNVTGATMVADMMKMTMTMPLGSNSQGEF